jgi:hypothetical protein
MLWNRVTENFRTRERDCRAKERITYVLHTEEIGTDVREETICGVSLDKNIIS